MSGPTVTWQMVGDVSKSGKAVDQATEKVQGITGKLQGVGKGMVIGAGMAAFNLLSGAVDTAIGKIGEAQQAFRDDQVSQEMLANALKNNIPNWNGNTDAVEAAAAAAEKHGFSDDEARNAMAKLVGVTHDQQEAIDLMNQAQDLARAKTIDLATASEILTKAHEGNGKALKSLGVDIGNAKTPTELLAAAMGNAAGAADVFAQTSEGKTAVSQQKVGEAMEKVGGIIDRVSQVAIPILADAFSNVVDIVSQVIDALAPLVTEISKRLEPVIRQVGPIAEQIFKAIGKTVKDLEPVFRTAFGVIGTVIDVAVKGIGLAFNTLSTAAGTVQKVFQALADFIGKVFGAVGGIVKGVFNGVIDAINWVIDRINGIQVHIHVGPVDLDWDGLNLGHIKRLHQGGVVPGAPGSEVLAVLQAGEVVSPVSASWGGGGNIYITIAEGAFIDGPSVDRLANMIAQRLRFAPGN